MNHLVFFFSEMRDVLEYFDLERREGKVQELKIVDDFMVEIRWVDSMHSKIKVLFSWNRRKQHKLMQTYAALSPKTMQSGELNQTVSKKTQI